MKKFADALALLAVTAWVGGLWSIGYVAVPVLFQALPDRMLAGLLAGRMFTLIACIGITSACYLMLYYTTRHGVAALRQTAFRVTAIMLALTLASQFGLQPLIADLKTQAFPGDVMKSTFAGQFKMLHGIASTLYLIQSLLGVLLVLKRPDVSRATQTS